MKILGISRSRRFSPNSEERDAAIFLSVCQVLRAAGHEVCTYSEDDLPPTVCTDMCTYSAAFSMARGTFALQQLAAAEASGLRVINSPSHLLRTSRATLAALFHKSGIPIAGTRLLTDVDRMAAELTYPCWLKRGEACAQNSTDVSFVRTPDELHGLYARLRRRGVAQIVVSRHVTGDLVKFYGVAGTDFFHYDYPTRGGSFSKFGLEAINGAPHDYVFSAAALRETANRAALLSGIPVYGGDAIISPDGSICIIDFNDWPSFSACRAEAAQAIASLLTEDATLTDSHILPRQENDTLTL